MDWGRRIFWIPIGGAFAFGLLSACSPGPDMSGIVAERERSVHRYDISQAMASNGKVVVVGTQSGVILTSEDQGKSWKRIPLGNTSLVDMTVCGDQGFVAIDHYHKVWSADADGKKWKSVSLAMPRTPLAVTCDKQGGWWVVGANSVIAGSADRGATWKTTELGEDTQITALQFLDEKNAIALGEFGLSVRSDDGGVTWKKGPKLPSEFYPYAALFTSRAEGWVAGVAGQMLHTTDAGKTWNKQPNSTGASLNRLFMHEGKPFGVGSGGVIAHLEGESWRAVPYTDAVPVFLGGGTSLPGQSAIVIGGPGGLLRVVSTHAKQ
jgi:photosystem II stability/assembly factor-like uncharacterized protein